MSDMPADKVTHPQAGAPAVRKPVEPDDLDAKASAFAQAEGEADADEETGASPGTAQACSDLGLNSLAANLDRFGIKPPGQS